MNLKRICFLLPSLTAGGAERVMATLANYFVQEKNVELHLILYLKNEQFYDIDNDIKIHTPSFDYKKYPQAVSTILVLKYIRKKLRQIQPHALLSFGGKYNSLVLLAASGLPVQCFISDRSRPSISYGKLQNILNPHLYAKATGIIAQTNLAKELIKKKTNHSNVIVIGNPVRMVDCSAPIRKEKIILNAGRFIKSKNQKLLIDYFDETASEDWQLVFLGAGLELNMVKQYATTKKSQSRISFLGSVKEIDDWYLRASVFAFTSTSEGFPNALGEAMAAGLACISFDCEAGPADLIDDGLNGFLVEVENHFQYKEKLERLLSNEALREKFGEEAKRKMQQFDEKVISDQYFKFMSTLNL